jgi:hypothetical protein
VAACPGQRIVASWPIAVRNNLPSCGGSTACGDGFLRGYGSDAKRDNNTTHLGADVFH